MLVNANEMAGSWGSEVHTSGLKTATSEACSGNSLNPPVELKSENENVYLQ